jgi:hypothetical protein
VSSRSVVGHLLAAVVLGLLAAAPAAAAEPKAKSTQTEAVWVDFDPEKNTVLLKIREAGKGARPPRHLVLRKGREASFNVIPTGSILKRTSVAINGMKGEITDIPPGKTVNVYWIQDPNDDQARFARKIDVIFSDEELEERYGIEDVE